MDMTKTTVRIGDGPEVPFADFRAAVGRLTSRHRSRKDLAAVAASPLALIGKELKTMATEAASETKPDTGGIAADRLRSIVDRIERLEEERKALGNDITDIYTEAKSAGFDVKVLRQLLRIRKQKPAEIEEQETLLDVYKRALGM